ncbi:acetyl-CoA carboxylase carboxyltransferase subunit beta [Enorma massiliensis]|uniref:acetyl-CoA carboxylase, carboxyltransferase subunit beta n=1 Tax=Enorma massiliensis TaxID=1472761 RepID=UPI00195A2FEA|nr:acetyl-CoA carboxylase, carboxyltransferase subunit beta [Enorma massiliensis]MBM6893152.1 acetyl-CoA carboxylase carboxyltransferase subunit beta [Enorma massiliensis]
MKTKQKGINKLEGPVTDIPIELPERRAYVKCPGCRRIIDLEQLEASHDVCPRCGHHMRLGARKRLEATVDAGSFEEWGAELEATDILAFPGYTEKLERAQRSTGDKDAVLCGRATIGGEPCAIFIMDGDFMMGSMGSVVGEKICRTFERAAELRLPVVGITVSGGARMQEGTTSLMQMAKVSGARARFAKTGLPYLVLLTDPTTGGVTASFAMEGDIILAEPGALIGFAGPRVVEQTTHKRLPAGFQRSEFLLEHGFLDLIVERENVPATLSELLALHAGRIPAADAPHVLPERHEPHTLLKKAGRKRRRSGNEAPSAYDIVQAARSVEHPTALELIELGFDGFIELHGDRYFSDDPAIVGGIAWVGDQVFTVIGTERGRSTKERVARNFGSAHPEGYRKAQRLMMEAERFGRPVLCLIDTAGAYCGIGAEERGQGEAIASNLVVMSELETPIVSIVVGEGGSGGALALAVADRVLMLDNAAYSVVSPEGCASILWKTTDRAADAAEALALTAPRLAELGIVDGTITSSGTHRELAERIIDRVTHELAGLASLKPDALVEARQAKFRAM